MSTERLEKQLEIATNALRQFKECDLNEHNCANLYVASQRIRNIAAVALAKMKQIKEHNELQA